MKATNTRQRSLFTLATVVAAFATLALADFELWRVFVDERAGVEHTAGDERARIVSDLRAVWRTTLAQMLAEQRAHVATVESDPLAPENGLLLAEGGKQIVPRVAVWRAGDDANLALYRAIVATGAVPSTMRDKDSAGLAAAAAAVRSAADAADFSAQVRAFLALRANVDTSPALTAAATLAVTDAMIARHDVDPSLLVALLGNGKNVGAARIEPVSRDLLRAAAHGELTRGDGDGLFDVFAAQCKSASVWCTPAQERWHDLADGVRIDLPVSLTAPVVGPHSLYLEPNADGVIGLRIDEAKLLSALVDGMKRRGSLRPEDSFETGEVKALMRIDDVPITIHSQRLDDEVEEAALRFHMKTGLLGAMSFMALGLVAAALIDQSRRRRFDALRSSFVAAVSHELRTPLASMRLLVESMLVGANDTKATERLERLGRDVDGLDFLVENILSFSRLERGKLVPKKERAWLGEIAADAVERCRSEARATPVAIAIDIAADNAVDVDPELAGLVVANLVRNAWQHNPRRVRSGASVRVRIEERDGEARVVVEDDGPGVSELDQPRIFEEFERGSRPASRGTGLGLALCRQIARAHGGDVTLAATSPAGSTFVFSVPLAHNMR